MLCLQAAGVVFQATIIPGTSASSPRRPARMLSRRGVALAAWASRPTSSAVPVSGGVSSPAPWSRAGGLAGKAAGRRERQFEALNSVHAVDLRQPPQALRRRQSRVVGARIQVFGQSPCAASSADSPGNGAGREPSRRPQRSGATARKSRTNPGPAAVPAHFGEVHGAHSRLGGPRP